MENFEIISCAPTELYSDGGYYDNEISLDNLIETSRKHSGTIDVLAEVFPGATIDRHQPYTTISPDPGFASSLDAFYRGINERFPKLAPSFLVRLRDAIIWNNMLFAVNGGRAVPVYELYRDNDRGEKGAHVMSRLAACEKRTQLDLGDVDVLFVGSAGSFNYGHWLVDDFPVFAGTRALRREGRSLSLLMSLYHSEMDRTRIEGASLALGERPDYRIEMLDRDTAYRVQNLHYVTPVSYHPVVKNPHAIQFIRDVRDQALFDVPSFANSDKIFIGRTEELWRNLLNNDVVSDLLSSYGFASVPINNLSLREQWATFAHARHVVGVMGAAMTSTSLCQPGIPLTYLAPLQWTEPFYWDLAAACNQHYTVLFGKTDESNPHIYRRDFSINVDCLASYLSSL